MLHSGKDSTSQYLCTHSCLIQTLVPISSIGGNSYIQRFSHYSIRSEIKGISFTTENHTHLLGGDSVFRTGVCKSVIGLSFQN
jgi:hypothetical protein